MLVLCERDVKKHYTLRQSPTSIFAAFPMIDISLHINATACTARDLLASLAFLLKERHTDTQGCTHHTLKHARDYLHTSAPAQVGRRHPVSTQHSSTLLILRKNVR